MNFYADVLPLLKEFTLFFQGMAPRVHLLHDSQVKVSKNFLALFVKPEFIPATSAELVSFKITDDVLSKRRDMYMGDAARKVSSGFVIVKMIFPLSF